VPDSRVDEAISVVARRQRWALEQKLEEVSLPGALAATVADRHGRSRSLLFEWRRQVRKGAMPGIVRAKAAPALVPVRIVEDAPKKTPRPRLPSCSSPERPGKVATVSNGRVLRVSAEVLGRLAAVLEARCWRCVQVCASPGARRDG